VARSITAHDVVVILDSAAGQRGVPKFIRCDYADVWIMPMNDLSRTRLGV